MTKDEIKALQSRLTALGYPTGGVDGIFGPATKRALVAFQNQRGLTPDGIYGPKTALALASPATSAAPFVYPTAADLRTLFRVAKSENLVPFADALPVVTPRLQMNTVLRLSHFIAQCGWECDQFLTYEEYASGADYEGRADLGNTKPGDGRRYKGRGPIQLTGRDNYRRATPFVRQLLGRPDLDLEATPEIVASDKAVGVATSLWYWSTHNLNAWADQNNASAVSRGVNRGNARSPKLANHEAERIALTQRVVTLISAIQSRRP